MDTEREDITPGHDSNGETTPGIPDSLIADPQERQERLTQIIRSSVAFPALIKTGHIIGAIDTLNRMDGLYSVPFGFNDNRVINIICDQRTAELISGIGDRTKLLPPGQGLRSALPPEIAGDVVGKEAFLGDNEPLKG